MSRKQERQTSKVLLPHESREAEDEVVRSCQRKAFLNEYKVLLSGKPIPSRNPLIKLMKLNSVLGEDGVIHCNAI